MTRLVRMEILKLRSTRSNILLAVASLAAAALLGLANVAIAGDPGGPKLGSPGWLHNVVGLSAIPAVGALLLGVLLSAGEHQHQTITLTFLVTPRRWRVVLAKLSAIALAAPALAFVMVVVAVGATLPALLADDIPMRLLNRDVLMTVLGVVLASALLGCIGVLLGLLVRSQIAAAVIVAGWALVLEGIVDTLAGGGLRRWMPGGAAADLAGNGGRPMWAAALLLAAWAAGLACVAVPTVRTRDVT